jgi:hypothetical protein
VFDLCEPSFGVGLALEALRSLTVGGVTVAGSVAGLPAPYATFDVTHRYLLLLAIDENGRWAAIAP